MAGKKNIVAAKKAKPDIVITRLFNAPVKLIWKAWTVPEHFMRWWGPKDFSCPVCTLDFRVGGRYINCMRSPEGKDYWTTGIYREIVPMKRIVSTDCFADEKGNVVPASHYGFTEKNWPLEMMVTVTFKESNGKTTMTLKHVGHPGGKMGEMATAGWNESLDKLAASL